MKPQYLVYDHNRFSAKMLVKFYYFSKKLSKTGKRTAWQLHGTCTPLIPMSSRVIRVYTAVKEQTAEIQKVGVNVNQIAKRVNSTGNAYKEDLEEIKGALEKIWQLQRYTLSKLR